MKIFHCNTNYCQVMLEIAALYVNHSHDILERNYSMEKLVIGAKWRICDNGCLYYIFQPKCF